MPESSTADCTLSLEDIRILAQNAQNDLDKIMKINSIVRQRISEDDIIGQAYETMISNLNIHISFSFDSLPPEYESEIKNQVQSLILQFHEETNLNTILSASIPAVYTEGNCIKYLRSCNGRHIVDTYPLGIAIVSGYSENGLPCVLINISELTDHLQKAAPLFSHDIAEEIKNRCPDEVYQAYMNNERYAELDPRRTGLNRFCNMNGKYGLTPIFKALKPSLVLDAFSASDIAAAKAREKKIIHQVLRKEVMGSSYEKKGLEEMAYAHENLAAAWKNPTVLYTSPPCVEKVEFVEPSAKVTNTAAVDHYRSRVASALGIPSNQYMKTINKIAYQEELILSRWYSIILEENNIPQNYCPAPHILNAEKTS